MERKYKNSFKLRNQGLRQSKKAASSTVQVIHLKEKEVLFSEGDSSESMYILKSGSIAIKKKNQLNQETLLSVLKPNQIVGEMGFFKNEPRTATAQALLPSQLIALPYRALHQEFKAFPQWVKTLIETIQLRLKVTNEKLSSLNEKLKLENEGEGSFFEKPTLQILLLLQLFCQNHHSIKENKKEVSFSLKTLNDLTLIYNFTSHQLKKVLKSLMDTQFIKCIAQGRGDYEVTLLDLKYLNYFINWFKDQFFIEPKKRLTLSLEEVSLLERILHFAEEKNEHFKDANEMRIENFLCMKEEFKNIQLLNEKGFLKLQEDENIENNENNKDRIALFFEISPSRLEKMTVFWKTIYVLKENKKLTKNFIFP